MRRVLVGAALVALALLLGRVPDAVAADPVRIDQPAALDLAEVSLTVPDDGRVTGPDDIAGMVERGDPVGAGAPAAAGAAVWLAARLANDSPETRWTLFLRQAYFSRIDLWVYDRDAAVASHASAGIGVEAAQAQPKFALGFEFPVTLPTHETRTLVLRLEPVFDQVEGTPVLAPIDVAHADGARRRIVFPLLLGTFLGMAALHVVLFVRFGGIANLLFVGTVVSIFLDWFVWLGGPHDLGLGMTVEASIRLSNLTWFVATFFILIFCLSFFASVRRALASKAALLSLYVLFVYAYQATEAPSLHLILIEGFLLISAGIILANAVVAVRTRVSGARLALAAYSIELANELLTYGSISVPWLATFGEWSETSFGFFDTGTLLSQILMNGLFSLALWERVRATTREREAALNAERLKTVHVAQLSHDIRSPLHAVQSAIGALVARGPPGVADPRQVELVQASVRSVVAMLDDMVDLARGGRAPPAVRHDGAVDLRRVVEDAAAVARTELGDRPVALRVDVAAAVPALVGGDGVAIRRILGNLLSNAVRVTSLGAVSIAVAPNRAPAARIRFEISDTGPGMTNHRAEQLFGPAAGGEGGAAAAGMGLKVARRLAEAMGGTLGASSRPGVGTTAWFEIPARPVPTEPAGRSVLGRGGGGAPRLRLLLVEDDRLTAAATTTILTIDGHDVTQVGTAAEAVDLAGRLPFDLALIDLGLSIGSGLEAVRAIRALGDPVRAGIPIVVATGDRGAGEEARQAALGIRSVLTKPFDVAELRRAIADGIGLGARSAPPAGDSSGGFLADLAGMLPPAGLRALLETGRAEIRSNVASLEAASSAGRPHDARRFAHRLAGSAGVLRLGRLVEVARAAEAAAAAGEHGALATAVDAVRPAAEAALDELDRWLESARDESDQNADAGLPAARLAP